MSIPESTLVSQAERDQLFTSAHRWTGSQSFVFTEQLQHEWDGR
jgi:hypothetical protein